MRRDVTEYADSVRVLVYSGKDPDKPWLFSLRREFVKYDPEKNALGTWPLYPEDDPAFQSPPPMPAVKLEAAESSADGSHSQAPKEDEKPALPPNEGSQVANEAQMTAVSAPATPARPPSKGWEDLTIEEKVHLASSKISKFGLTPLILHRSTHSGQSANGSCVTRKNSKPFSLDRFLKNSR